MLFELPVGLGGPPCRGPSVSGDRQLLRQYLDGDPAAQLSVLGQIHLAHVSVAEQAGDLGVREGLADQAVILAAAVHSWST